MKTRKQDQTQQQSSQPKPSSKASALPINKQPRMIGPYQVGESVGRGACGKVYKGLNFQNGQLVAIKQIALNHIKTEQKQSIQMEINLLKKLDHPNIVKYIDSIYTEHHLNIILEYVENGSLESLIRKFGNFPETLVAIYIQQVLHGLEYLHRQLVIHRDIKGGNILTTKDGIVKLADFGVATKLTDTQKSNSFAGTPYWMAPEVIEMSGQPTSACDIWSLGCTVIELLTGKPPYFSLNQYTAMKNMVEDKMPPIPEVVSGELKDFLAKCFEKDPYKRIDAKGLLEHNWLKKYDKNLFQKIISISNKLPEEVTNTIRMHIDQVDRSSTISRSQQKIEQRSESKEEALPFNKKIGASTNNGKTTPDDEEDGEIGDLGEEINDFTDVPIEKPKCLLSINNNPLNKTHSNQGSARLRKQTTTIQDRSDKIPSDKLNQTDIIYPGKQSKGQHTDKRLPAKRGSMKEEKKEYLLTEGETTFVRNPQKSKISGGQNVIQQDGKTNGQQVYQQVQLRSQNMNHSNSKQSLSMQSFNPNSSTAVRRTNNRSNDKSAGPGSGDGVINQRQQRVDLQMQRNEYQQAQKPSYQYQQEMIPAQVILNEESQHIQTSAAQRLKRKEQAQLNQQHLLFTGDQFSIDPHQQQQPALFQQPYSTQTPPQSNFGQFGFHKAKSNDLVIQTNHVLPPQVSPQQYHHHHNTTTSNYLTKIQKQPFQGQSPLNFQFQIDPTQQAHNQHLSMGSLQRQQSYLGAQNYDPRYISPMSAQNNLNRKIIDKRRATGYKYNSSMMPSPNVRQMDIQDYEDEDIYDDINDELGDILAYQGADYNQQIPQPPTQYMFGRSADFNARSGIQQRQPTQNHQRFGSSISQMNLYQEQQNQLHQMNYAQSIEDHIKRTQLSEQKMGRPHLSQLYGQQQQHHVQHKSVFSNFQGSQCSPQHTDGQPLNYLNQQHNKLNEKVGLGLDLDNSYDNYFETASNNNYQGNVDSLGDNINAIGGGPMINMQDLINVRESYSKKLLDEASAENSSRKYNLFMMMGGDISNNNFESNDHQLKMFQQKVNNRNGSQQQLQSLGSGRSNYSVQQQKQLEMMMGQQQTIDEGTHYAHQIQIILKQMEAGVAVQPETSENTTENKLTTEDNIDLEQSIKVKCTVESEMANNIRKLTQLLKDQGSEQFKGHVIKSLRYLILMSLLEKDEEIAYPTLQLINQICENSPKHLEIMCLTGVIPYLIKFGQADQPREIQIEVAYFIGQIYQCSREALQMFICNQGLTILIQFLGLNYEENKDLVMLAIDSFLVIFDELTNLQVPPEELSVMLSRIGLLENLSVVISRLIYNSETSTILNEQSAAEKYLEKAFDVFQQLASGPHEVKERVCTEQVLQENLVKVVNDTINDPSPFTLLIVKRFIKLMQLVTQATQTYNSLEKCGVVKLLVDMLQFFLNDIHHIQLQLVYDTLKLINVLCKLSHSRTEQAAMGSLLVPVKDLVLHILSKNDQISRSKKGKLLKVILPILHSFITGSQVTRQLLNGYQIQHLLLSIIQIQQQLSAATPNSGSSSNSTKDHSVNAKVLDFYVLWLQTDSQQIEAFLAKRQTLEVFFNIFLLSPRNKVFLYVFSALNRMAQFSPLISKSLAQNTHLADKLANQLLTLDSSININDELDIQGSRGPHHPKNSSSARSYNNLLIGGDPNSNLQTIENQTSVQNKNTQQAYVMKELMEILQAMISRNEGHSFLEKHNLMKIVQKVAGTAEQHNLVILQQIAQNILSTHEEQQHQLQSSKHLVAPNPDIKTIQHSQKPNATANSIREKSSKNPDELIQGTSSQRLPMFTEGNQGDMLQQKRKLQEKQPKSNNQHILMRQNTTGTHSTRAKSPIYH